MMKKTKHFQSLPKHIQQMFSGPEIDFSLTKLVLHNDPKDQRSNFDKRSIVCVDEENNLIYKKFTSKGQSDDDIKALLALQNNPYAPKLYLYKDREFLLMEKVSGKDLNSLIQDGYLLQSNDLQAIRVEYEKAMHSFLEVDINYVDFKLEHLFWEKKSQELRIIDFSIVDDLKDIPKEFKEELLEGLLETFDSKVKEALH